VDRAYHLNLAQHRRPPGEQTIYGKRGLLHAPLLGDAFSSYARKWNVEDLGRMLFEDSCTDMAMAQAVVLYDVYKSGFAPVQAQYEFAQAYPDRALFCGGVDPLYPSVAGALEEMERQVHELDARSFKFYSGHLGKSWRCDDPQLAYPLYEKGRELGIKVFQFHKGFPITRANLETLSPLDIQQAALDFPDLTFAVHHLALPYFEEVVYLAARFPNVVLVLSGTMHLPLIAPWEFNNYMGRLLRDVGSDRLLWGSEAPLLGDPQPMIEWFWNMQIEPELQSRFGYPQITEEDKRRILGENQARLFGVDIHRAKGRAQAMRAAE
jgi:predicted TIM-barrel fold metal-dependent hydrolase